MESKTSVLTKLRGIGEVFGYIVDLIFLWDYFTTKGMLSYLTASIGANAQAVYNIVVAVALVSAFIVPFYFGYKFFAWRTKRSGPVRGGTTVLLVQPKLWGVPAVLEIVKNGGEVRVIGADFSRWVHSRTQILDLVIKKGVKFVFLAPDSVQTADSDSNLQRAIDAQLVQKKGEIEYLASSVEALRDIFSDEKNADELKKEHGWKMEIELFDLPLTHSMAIGIPVTRDAMGEKKLDWGKAEVHLWPYLHTVHSDERPYKIVKNVTQDDQVKFKKCLDDWQYVYDARKKPKGA